MIPKIIYSAGKSTHGDIGNFQKDNNKIELKADKAKPSMMAIQTRRETVVFLLAIKYTKDDPKPRFPSRKPMLEIRAKRVRTPTPAGPSKRALIMPPIIFIINTAPRVTAVRSPVLANDMLVEPPDQSGWVACDNTVFRERVNDYRICTYYTIFTDSDRSEDLGA